MSITATLTSLLPNPIKDILLAPSAARSNSTIAAERLIKSSIRITLATIGIFASHKLLWASSSVPAALIAIFFPGVIVFSASATAGTITLGFEYCYLSTYILVSIIALRAFEAFDLFAASFSLIGLGIGWACIHIGDESIHMGSFSGLLEPYIAILAEKYRTPVANSLEIFHVPPPPPPPPGER